MNDRIQLGGKMYIPLAAALEMSGMSEAALRKAAERGQVWLRAAGKNIYVELESLNRLTEMQKPVSKQPAPESAQVPRVPAVAPSHPSNVPKSASSLLRTGASHMSGTLAGVLSIVALGVGLVGAANMPVLGRAVANIGNNFRVVPTSQTAIAVETKLGEVAGMPDAGTSNGGQDFSASASSATSTRPIYYVYNYPVIERIVERERLLSDGGISEELLNIKLQELNADISARLSALSSSNTTQITNVYAAAATIGRIEHLDGLDLTNPTITGGSISGVSLSAGSLSGIVDIDNGGTGTSTAPSYGQLLMGDGAGAYSLVSTSSLGISGTAGALLLSANTWSALQLFSANASSTQLSVFQKAYFGGTATTTIDSEGNIFGAGTLSAGTTTVTNLVSTNTSTSTFAGGVETKALNITGSATSTAVSGIDILTGCFAVNGTCISGGGGGVSLSAANTWSALQLFSANASSTQLSVFNKAYFGGTATSTFDSTGALTLTGALTYGGVTLSNAVTGTGNMVLSASPTLTGTLTAVAANFSGNVGIGTTTPWAKLSVAGVAGGTDALFSVSSSSAAFATSTVFHIDSNGNVGIGTSTPAGKFSVTGSGTGTGILAKFFNSAFTTVVSVLDNGTAYFLGNVGIGTTTPTRKLSVTDTVASAQVALSYDDTRYAELRVDSTGDFNMAASGGDFYLNNDNFWVCTGGSISSNGCPSGSPTGVGNIIAENKLGIGTSTPASKLTIETQDTTSDFFQVGSTTAQNLFNINANGRVGIGTSTPFARLAIGSGGAIVTTENSLTDGATITVSWLDGNQQKVILGGNRTIAFTNYISGQILRLVVCQDATGSRTLTWPAAVRWQGGTAPTLTTTAAQCDLTTFVATNATSSLVILGAAALAF